MTPQTKDLHGFFITLNYRENKIHDAASENSNASTGKLENTDDPSSSATPETGSSRLSLKTSDGRDVWFSTVGSCLLLSAAIYLIYYYHELFGFTSWEDMPEHWSWLGGLVGVFAVLMRLAIIGIFALPYVLCAVVGLQMSRRVTTKAKGFFLVFNWILITCHAIMLLPLVRLLFGVWL